MKIKLPPRPQLPDLVLALGSASLVLVCLFLLAIPAISKLQDRARLSRVKGNAVTLQLAAETYAARNQGQYPLDALDLLVYLPEDRAPDNPFTGEATQFKGQVGDLTYRSPRNGRDYVIEAWGPGPAGGPRRVLVLSSVRR